MKIDPYKHKEKYLNWRKKVGNRIPDISLESSNIIFQYLSDMEKGLNVSSISIKGGRSYIRLNTLREKLNKFSRDFEKLYNLKKITDVSEEQLVTYFSDMKSGKLLRRDGKSYKSVDTTARVFKAFWHWYQKISRKKGIDVEDITLDLDTRQEKPEWVYLTEKEVKLLCDNAKIDYRMLIMFLFDTGIRAPTELMNVRVSDIHNNYKELNIREETSKTFGRRIKLMLCSDMLKDYILNNQLKPEDYLFKTTPHMVNKYLKRLAIRVLGDRETLARGKISDITMYDFRHCSCCYWLPRYKSESALKYRFGWKESDKIHYYSEFIGMTDTISENDMLIDITRTEIEKKLERYDKESSIKDDKIKQLEIELAEIKNLVLKLAKTSKSIIQKEIETGDLTIER